MSAATTTASDPHPSTDRRGLADLLAPGPQLRAEGAALAAGAIGLYASTGASWWLFGLLLLAPDLGMLGYVAGRRLGAATYNLAHTLVLPLALGASGLAAGSSIVTSVSLVWLTHCGLDRAFGYGLKYHTHFEDTHLQRVGER